MKVLLVEDAPGTRNIVGTMLKGMGYNDVVTAETGLEALDIGAVRIWLGDVCIVRGGGRAAEYTEQAGRTVMAESEFSIRVDLGRGEARTRILTCDLSYDYVRINAEYRT